MSPQQQERLAEAQIEQAQAGAFTERCKALMYVAFGLTAIAFATVAVLS
ncbi:hypothetical protein [Stenotrophomonas sp. PS02298]|nr:hypothetical protein [Stenotrophomonas sp. PS02298]